MALVLDEIAAPPLPFGISSLDIPTFMRLKISARTKVEQNCKQLKHVKNRKLKEILRNYSTATSSHVFFLRPLQPLLNGRSRSKNG